ncbi:hypothetical protein [Actinomadura vinacea]|uniref:hypothetical protein n=1 Tax=Actinomadura vinacea TaxID=115336 RepID=UPI0031D20CA1
MHGESCCVASRDLPPDYADARNFIVGLVVVLVLAALMATAEDGVESAVCVALIASIIAVVFVGSLAAAIRTEEATTGIGLVVTAGASVTVDCARL